MSKLMVIAVGHDPYDHDNNIQTEVMVGEWETQPDGSLHPTHRDYQSHYGDRVRRGIYGWCKAYMLDTDTGLTTKKMEFIGPVKKRIEVNVAAKKTGTTVKKKALTAHELLYSVNPTLGTFTTQTDPLSWLTPAPPPPVMVEESEQEESTNQWSTHND